LPAALADDNADLRAVGSPTALARLLRDHEALAPGREGVADLAERAVLRPQRPARGRERLADDVRHEARRQERRWRWRRRWWWRGCRPPDRPSRWGSRTHGRRPSASSPPRAVPARRTLSPLSILATLTRSLRIS